MTMHTQRMQEMKWCRHMIHHYIKCQRFLSHREIEEGKIRKGLLERWKTQQLPKDDIGRGEQLDEKTGRISSNCRNMKKLKTIKSISRRRQPENEKRLKDSLVAQMLVVWCDYSAVAS